ncbi:glycosyltransferase [Camelliibacillus cellulosilyticus]|uniref:Glycosyltransferase n=1 Tax=Camelliibacillus cellulosilyticus TaxID=2174486 RepID=A0ABV9GQ05_9BACL
MNGDLISIIVPIYNVEKFLSKCIESICHQTYRNLEIILVNDGSSDRCGRICDEYARKDNRIKVIHKENGGLSSARNAGLKIASGEYLGFVDADDYIDKRMYQLLYEQAVRQHSDIVICDFFKINEGGNLQEELCEKNDNPSITRFTNLEALDQIYTHYGKDAKMYSGFKSNDRWIVVWNKLFKRHLFNDLYFLEGKIHEDEFIAHELLFRANRIIYISQCLYYYVQNQKGIMHSPFSIKDFDLVYAYKERVTFFRKKKQKELYKKAAKCYMEAFFHHYYYALLNLGDKKKQIDEFRRNGHFVFMLVNPLIGWKQKFFIVLFTLFPRMFERYIG